MTGIAEGPEAIRAILGFARTLYEGIRNSTSSDLTETAGSSRTTHRWCAVNRSAAWW